MNRAMIREMTFICRLLIVFILTAFGISGQSSAIDAIPDNFKINCITAQTGGGVVDAN